jgi:hypothetical protein
LTCGDTPWKSKASSNCAEGIEDLELHAAISSLQVGDSAKLSFRADKVSFAGETLLVRITSIKGCAFRGKVAAKPARIGLWNLRVGSLVRFTATHIHSIAKR